MNEEKFDLRFMGKLDLQQIERATQYQRRTRLGGRLISLSLFFIKYSLTLQTHLGCVHGCSSIGRVVVSKTIGWEFESLHPCKYKVLLLEENGKSKKIYQRHY